MRILLDTDVILDVLLDRHQSVPDALGVLAWAEDNPGQAGVAWHSLSNIAYIVQEDLRPFMTALLEFVEVAPIATREAQQALGLPMNDLEDAMQAAAALGFEARYIVSRNFSHYRRSPIPALSPAHFLKQVDHLS